MNFNGLEDPKVQVSIKKRINVQGKRKQNSLDPEVQAKHNYSNINKKARGGTSGQVGVIRQTNFPSNEHEIIFNP
jgi:hypothetical protein